VSGHANQNRTNNPPAALLFAPRLDQNSCEQNAGAYCSCGSASHAGFGAIVMQHSLVHRSTDREKTYRQLEPVEWSQELNCWMVTSPDLIKTVQKTRDLVVINHQAEVEMISHRLSLDLDCIAETLASMPLSTEGPAHTTRRRRIAEKIRAAKPTALSHFADLADSTIAHCVARRRNVDLVAELFCPLVSDIVFQISGVKPRARPDHLSVTQLFDRALGLKRRLLINAELQHMRTQLPEGSGADDTNDARTLAVLASDSLLGSFSLSFLERVQSQPGTPMSGMDWSRQLTATSVPFVERQAVADLVLAGRQISAGQRLRLYLDRLSYEPVADRTGFFGAGRHACPGRPISQNAWQILGTAFSRYPHKVTIGDIAYRNADSMFSFPTKLEVDFNEP